MPISISVRDPSDDERSVIGRRMDHKRRAAAGVWRSRASELRWLTLFFGAAAIALGVAIVKWPSVPLGFGLVMCSLFSSLGIIGKRMDRAKIQHEADELARTQAERARAVTEYRLAADRIVVAADKIGDGDVWWLFSAGDGTWLVIERGQWEDVDPDALTWRRDVVLGVDDHHNLVSTASSGAPLTVERLDLQPPDYLPTPNTRYWSPPDDLGPLPAVITGDPILSAD